MSDCRAGESRETTHEQYARLLDLPLEPVGTDDDDLTDHYASTPIFADLRAKYAADELTDAELADAAADAIALTKPTLILDPPIEDRRDHRTGGDIFSGLIRLADDIEDNEPEQPADVVVEQWAWWKKWALILAVGTALAIIGYGWLVQA